MKWSSARLAFCLCLVVCLLVAAIRVRTLHIRALIHEIHALALKQEPGHDLLFEELERLRRPEELKRRHLGIMEVMRE